MATTIVTYGTRTQIDGGNLNPAGVGLPNSQVNTLNAVQNAGAGNDGYRIDFSITCSAAPTAGDTIIFYMIKATDVGTGGTHTAGTYTDSLSPGSANVTLNNARVVATYNVNTTSPYTIADEFFLPVVVPPPFWTLAVKNSSGVALAGSGNTVFVTPFVYTTA